MPPIPLHLRRLFLPPRALWHDIPYVSPQLLPEITFLTGQLSAALTPASPSECQALIERLFLHFARHAGEEHATLMADYLWFLGPFPHDVLREGIMQLIRNHRYPSLPTVAQCLHLMEPALAARHYAHTKLTELQLAARHWSTEPPAIHDP